MVHCLFEVDKSGLHVPRVICQAPCRDHSAHCSALIQDLIYENIWQHDDFTS